ncbi:hypothetical protein ACFVFQ_34175 [Streptomyces sp. NPDC057743]|uniref:hypothetical protein n=1 Tax=Streptomyces sp. NPDC057743 TaxID=3346236 RepID=UPI0036A8C315
MTFFDPNEPTVRIHMTGHMSYGPPNSEGEASRVLLNGEEYDVPQSEANWLTGSGLADRV